VVFDGQQDIGSGNIEDLSDFFYIIGVRVLGTVEKQMAGPEGSPRLHLFKHRDHVRNVVQEIEHPPYMDVSGKGSNRQTDHVSG
jgi:hypothetical protein